jgi:polar amino acid transport system substrate-binding protein
MVKFIENLNLRLLLKRLLIVSFIHFKKGFLEQFSTLFILCLLINSTAIAKSNLSDSEQVIKAIESLEWVTEEYPPFNYRDPQTGEIKGIAVEVLLKIFGKLGISTERVNLKIYPWARGYHRVLNNPGTVLFSTTYTQDRLEKMKFVGPIAPHDVAVIAPRAKQLSISFPNELNGLKVGVIRDDIGEQLLIKSGVNSESIDQLNSGLSMVKKLASGRIDAISYAQATTFLLFKDAGINPDDFETLLILKKSAMGYAFHSSTDTKILEPIQKALNELSNDGTLDKLQSKYGLKRKND